MLDFRDQRVGETGIGEIGGPRHRDGGSAYGAPYVNISQRPRNCVQECILVSFFVCWINN